MVPSLSGSDLGLGERGYKTVECKLIGPFLLIIGFICGKYNVILGLRNEM